MKIKDIIVENKGGSRPANADYADTGEWKFRDVGGYDRTYNLNRIMMAAAMADGSNKPVDVDPASWVEKYNVARPYSEVEHNMMKQAFKTVNSDYKHSEKDHKSKETPDTHKTSPVPAKRKNKYGV